MEHFSDSDLEAYLDEALDAGLTGRIESAVRGNPALLRRLAELNQRRDQGWHSLGDIWRRHRVSCPSRDDLGSYLLDALEPELTDFIFFHLTEVGCRYCRASLNDLEQATREGQAPAAVRRQKYFQSSAGYLHAST